MIYAKINLSKTDYKLLDKNWQFIRDPDLFELDTIYKKYCCYKKFKSVMPIFDSEYTDNKNDIIGYFDNDVLVAFSLLRKYNSQDVEALQFAWTYHKPKMRLGIESLKHECALYKSMGYKFLYLGGADEYKTKIDGFEILQGC
jgi:hypothetical protein